MSNKVLSAIWFAIAGTAIGYGMREGYRHFSTAEEPWKVLGYLSVFVTTGCSTTGMISIWRSFEKRPGPRALPRSPNSWRPDIA
jgi:hypothetical protein